MDGRYRSTLDPIQTNPSPNPIQSNERAFVRSFVRNESPIRSDPIGRPRRSRSVSRPPSLPRAPPTVARCRRPSGPNAPTPRTIHAIVHSFTPSILGVSIDRSMPFTSSCARCLFLEGRDRSLSPPPLSLLSSIRTWTLNLNFEPETEMMTHASIDPSITHPSAHRPAPHTETTIHPLVKMSARSALLRLGRTTAFAPMCATTTMTAIGARAYSTGTSRSMSRRRGRPRALSTRIHPSSRAHDETMGERPTDGKTSFWWWWWTTTSAMTMTVIVSSRASRLARSRRGAANPPNTRMTRHHSSHLSSFVGHPNGPPRRRTDGPNARRERE
jgi:hypothetical protein